MRRLERYVVIVSALATIVDTNYYSCDAFSPAHPQSKWLRLKTAMADVSAQEAMERTKAHLEKLRSQDQKISESIPADPIEAELESMTREYLQFSANALKVMLQERKLPRNGRKPDLAKRLAESDLREKFPGSRPSEEEMMLDQAVQESLPPKSPNEETLEVISSFAGQKLTRTAGLALAAADFKTPTPIQAAALPKLFRGESMIMHASTGSGKTLAYVLPISEALWTSKDTQSFHVILTPTRELAAQVAGIATVLCPPGSVRFVARPTNLLAGVDMERGELPNGGVIDSDTSPRLFIGSAKAVMTSLYGNSELPASPTPKPAATAFLKNVKTIILDEVDRLLNVDAGGGKYNSGSLRHEKPAAKVTAAVVRMTLGRAQVVAASATVGRPLRRALARVLGLQPKECPDVVRPETAEKEKRESVETSGHVGRAVTIPDTVSHYVLASESTGTGKVLTTAYHAIQALQKNGPRKMLLVLSKGFNMNTKNVIGALKHFNCQPEPQSLLDRLESAATDGTDGMMERHRVVSGATGVGETISAEDSETTLLVTGEDTVRGLHIDGLDVVLVVGRPAGPDEYTHIAGRTGRAGKSGIVVNIGSQAQAKAMVGWERMLSVEIQPVELSDVENL